jgi:ABC-type dipeptide/oligopeptide/nickel transport system ATPase subunit
MVRVGGDDVQQLPRLVRSARVQLVLQDATGALHPQHSVRDLVGEGLVVHGLATGRDLDTRVRTLLHEVGLDDELLARRPGDLSGGQRQRVALARALAVEPQVLLCDEITASLDVSERARVLHLLQKRRAARALTLVWITHDLAPVRHLCTHVVKLDDGRMLEAGPVDAVLARCAHPLLQMLR